MVADSAREDVADEGGEVGTQDEGGEVTEDEDGADNRTNHSTTTTKTELYLGTIRYKNNIKTYHTEDVAEEEEDEGRDAKPNAYQTNKVHRNTQRKPPKTNVSPNIWILSKQTGNILAQPFRNPWQHLNPPILHSPKQHGIPQSLRK